MLTAIIIAVVHICIMIGVCLRILPSPPSNNYYPDEQPKPSRRRIKFHITDSSTALVLGALSLVFLVILVPALISNAIPVTPYIEKTELLMIDDQVWLSGGFLSGSSSRPVYIAYCKMPDGSINQEQFKPSLVEIYYITDGSVPRIEKMFPDRDRTHPLVKWSWIGAPFAGNPHKIYIPAGSINGTFSLDGK